MMTTGKRRDFPDRGDGTTDIPEPGEYGKAPYGWIACPPGHPGLIAGLAKHQVIEHEDGTITVSPSILVTGHHDRQWHGYLEHGIWREV